MELLGIETSREQVEKLINEIDEDGNGEIDFDEFLQVGPISDDAHSPPIPIRNSITLIDLFSHHHESMKGIDGQLFAPGKWPWLRPYGCLRVKRENALPFELKPSNTASISFLTRIVRTISYIPGCH